ncbi:hypothetical protein NN802_002392 [Listeria monocytogenes]|uniref:hypothetical protein n=1 Tax=Listeria monocytogenes TaxID=1639 RepID=UPI0034A246D3|nr:hypothetical protein [Listeria monocytogenes]
MLLKIIMDSGKEYETENYENANDLLVKNTGKPGIYWFSLEDGTSLSFDHISSVEEC